MSQLIIEGLVERLLTSASESEMGRNLAGTPQTCRAAATQLLAMKSEIAAMKGALEEARDSGRGVLGRMASNLANGKGVEADDGEKCFIVHSDDIGDLRRAIDRIDALISPNAGGGDAQLS